MDEFYKLANRRLIMLKLKLTSEIGLSFLEYQNTSFVKMCRIFVIKKCRLFAKMNEGRMKRKTLKNRMLL